MSKLVETLTLNNRRVVLIGTAHISKKSAQLVKTHILAEKPDALLVELDEQRMKNLQGDSSWKDFQLHQALRRKKGVLLLSTIVLSAYQRRIAKKIGVTSGVEMLQAIETAQSHNITVYPCDRKIQTTLLRAWRRSSLLAKLKLFTVMIASLFQRESISEEEVERLKEGNVIDGMLHELASYLPHIKHVLIDERDAYIAARIIECTSPHLVAVVGAGHLKGIVACLKEYQRTATVPSLKELEHVPPPSVVGKILMWIIPLVVVALIGWGFINSGWQQGLVAMQRWVLVNGSLSALGCLIARAHPITTISSFVAAPITSLNPTIGVGFVTAFIEVSLRKPRAIDLAHIADDTLTLKGWYSNRISHALLVFVLSSVGSAIGTFVALPLLF